jgi:hypothetical protein
MPPSQSFGREAPKNFKIDPNAGRAGNKTPVPLNTQAKGAKIKKMM